jgi:hypothetical protein
MFSILQMHKSSSTGSNWNQFDYFSDKDKIYRWEIQSKFLTCFTSPHMNLRNLHVLFLQQNVLIML